MSVKSLTQRLSFSLMLISMIFASQLAIASSDSGTLTPGSLSQECAPPFLPHFVLVGYISSGFGTYSPTGLTGGKTVAEIVDETAVGCGTTQSIFNVSGFSSDPGKSWLTSITCNGVKNLSSASSYGYSSSTGIASWAWSQKFGLSNGAQVSCTIVHS